MPQGSNQTPNICVIVVVILSIHNEKIIRFKYRYLETNSLLKTTLSKSWEDQYSEPHWNISKNIISTHGVIHCTHRIAKTSKSTITFVLTTQVTQESPISTLRHHHNVFDLFLSSYVTRSPPKDMFSFCEVLFISRSSTVNIFSFSWRIWHIFGPLS